MKIEIEKLDDVNVIRFQGRLALGDNEEVLSREIDRLLQDGERSILIDLGEVDYIDSNGLGELVASSRRAREVEGSIKLLRPQERIRQTLQLSMLLPLFEVYDSEDEALASFS